MLGGKQQSSRDSPEATAVAPKHCAENIDVSQRGARRSHRRMNNIDCAHTPSHSCVF